MNTQLRKVIFFGVLTAIPLSAYLFVFSPRSADIKTALADIRAQEVRLALMTTVIESAPDFKASLSEGERLISQVEAKLPRRQDVEGILEQIWQMARRQDLTVRSVKTKDTEGNPLYRELPLEVVMSGSFEGFYRFLLELENLQRVTRMSDLTLKDSGRAVPGSTEAPNGSISARFILRIYFAEGTTLAGAEGNR